MVKILEDYAPQSPAPILTGRQITREQYERLILNQHAIYAEHRARCAGWRWLFTTSSATLTGENGTAGNPDLTYYQPRVLLQRPDGGGDFVIGVRVYGQNYEIDAGLSSFGFSGGSETLTGTTVLEWSSFEVNLGSFPGDLPLDFYFRARSLSGTASIYRIIVDEPRIPNGVNTVP